MLICVDVGNTTIAIGIFCLKQEKYQLQDTMCIETKVERTMDEYGHIFLENIRHLNLSINDVKGIIISSVVPYLDFILEESFVKYFHIQPHFVNVDMPLEMNICIDHPKQLGADLLVGAYMALKKYQVPLIVVDMGTATTFVAVDRNKNILGVIIYPGVVESFRNLISSTSLLESAKIKAPKHIIGKNTEESLQSGMIYASSSVVDGTIKKMKEEMKEENVQIILTGGVAKYIAPYCNNVIYDEHLLLEGLKEIYCQLYK